MAKIKKKKEKKKKEMSILIVAKQNVLGIKQAQKLEKMLHRYTKNIHFDRPTAFRLRKIGTSISKFRGDLIITVGGDGTFLLTAHLANVPILPVKIEGKGFLCTTTFDYLEKNLKRVFKQDYIIIERTRLKCTQLRTGFSKFLQQRDYPLSINEIAFARKRPSKLLNIEMEVDGTAFKITGDGVMFSTPSGSTAYNASAGGSIVDPEIDAISVIPLYTYYSRMKPMVIPVSKKITVTVQGGDCALVVDGHGGDYFKSNAKFVIEKAKPLKVIAFEQQNFYSRIKTTLMGE